MDYEELESQNMMLQAQVKRLKKELAKHEWVVGKFEAWYSDEECPYTQHGWCAKNLPSEKEKENLSLNEEDRFPFDSEYDCDESMQGWCWSKYYAKQFSELPKP